MNTHSPVLAMATAVALFLMAPLLFGQSEGIPGDLRLLPDDGRPRRALVVGNADYETGQLRNPVNDARAVAAELEAVGFDVLLRTDRSRSQMVTDLREFRRSIEPGSVSLFFFAGHGVQVDGTNYLLPQDNADIADSIELAGRAIDAQAYVETMVDAGSGLNIVVLDACRDNPLPAASRTMDRGLNAMDPPRGSDTVIFFATRAGDVAEDGSGRNSAFTQALVERLRTPDVDVLALFNEVGVAVETETGGRQVPTFYSEPLSEPFFFVTAEMVAAQARAEAEAAAAEVAALNQEYEQLVEELGSELDADRRADLEVERQRQEAILASQRQQSERLEAEAARREREARAAEARREELAEQAAADALRREELAQLASARRQEIERLAADALSENPDALVSSIEQLEAVLREVSGEYAAAWTESERELTVSYEARVAEIDGLEPEIWETDDDFADRVRTLESDLERDHQRRLRQTRREIETQRDEQTEEIRRELEDARETLRREYWTLRGNQVSLEVGEFDRNGQVWPFTVRSEVSWLPLDGISLDRDFSRMREPRELIIALNEAVQAGALAAEINWKIERDDAFVEEVGINRYYVIAHSVTIRNLVTDRIVASEFPRERVASFLSGEEVAMAVHAADLWISVDKGEPGIFVDGTLVGNGQRVHARVPIGSETVRLEWPDGAEQVVSIEASFEKPTSLEVIKPDTELRISLDRGSAEITLDGEFLERGRTAEQMVVGGRHTVRADWGDGIEASVSVTVPDTGVEEIQIERPPMWQVEGRAGSYEVPMAIVYVPRLSFRSVESELMEPAGIFDGAVQITSIDWWAGTSLGRRSTSVRNPNLTRYFGAYLEGALGMGVFNGEAGFPAYLTNLAAEQSYDLSNSEPTDYYYFGASGTNENEGNNPSFFKTTLAVAADYSYGNDRTRFTSRLGLMREAFFSTVNYGYWSSSLNIPSDAEDPFHLSMTSVFGSIGLEVQPWYSALELRFSLGLGAGVGNQFTIALSQRFFHGR